MKEKEANRMAARSLRLGGEDVAPDQIIELLERLDLVPLVIRRYTERVLGETMTPTEEEQIQYQRDFLANQKISSASELNSWLQKNHLSESQLSKRLFWALQIDQFKAKRFNKAVEPLFLERKSNLDMAMYSMIRTKEKAKVNELYIRLDEEEDTFADLASEFAEGQEQQFNGLIGPIELGRINPAIAERLRISKSGQLWPPFEQDGWWVLLRLEKLYPAQLDKSMRQKILNERYEEWIQERVRVQIEESGLNSQTHDFAKEETSRGEQKTSPATVKSKNKGLGSWLKNHFSKE